MSLKGKSCPLTYVTGVLSKKWSIVVIYYLLEGEKRFSELERMIHEISPKVLASTLEHLMKHEVVERIVYDSKPVMVKYRLTEKGRDLSEVIKVLSEWSGKWSNTGNGYP